MDLFLLILSFIIMIIGIIGSIIPVLPGPLSSWVGLFIFSNISNVEVSSKLLLFSLIIALIIFILDYIIPIYTSKKFGASKYGPEGGKFFLPSTENFVRTLHSKSENTPITYLISQPLGCGSLIF